MKTVSNMLISLGLSLVILLGSFFLLVQSPWFYRTLMKMNGVYEDVDLDRSVIDEAAKSICDYMVKRDDHLIVTEGNRSLFKAQEIFHMKEVRDIFSVMLWGFILIFLLTVWGIFLKENKRRVLRGQFVSMILLFIFFGVASLFFEKAFLMMHKTLFGNELWAFTHEHYLIRLLPSGFFLGFLVTTIVLAFMISLILFLLTFLRRKKDA